MKTLLPLFLLALYSCAHGTESTKPMKATSAVTVGESLDAYHYKDIYFSKQPSTSDIAKLKAQGFKHIINFRQKGEHDEKAERKQVESLGLNYSHMPFPSGELTDSYISQVTKAVVKHRKEGKTLIHCSSGNRVAIWVGGHFNKDHKYTPEKSLIVAKKMGLNHAGSTTKLVQYLDKQKK